MHPVRILMPHEQWLYGHHLLRLDPGDRRLRFGALRDDAAVAAHAAGLRPARDVILARFDDELRVVGAVHIALTSVGVAEFAFSVDGGWRGRGLGVALFARALIFARNRGIRTAVIYCLAENRAMRSLARKARMTIETTAGDSEGTVDLPPPTPASVVSEMVSEHAGLCDYALKVHRQTTQSWSGGLRRAA